MLLGRLHRLGQDQIAPKPFSAAVDGIFLVLLLIGLREVGADVGELRLGRVVGDEVDAVAVLLVQLPVLRPRRRVVGDQHRGRRQQADRRRLIHDQVERLADADIDHRVGLERLDLQQLRREVGDGAVEHHLLDLDAAVVALFCARVSSARPMP